MRKRWRSATSRCWRTTPRDYSSRSQRASSSLCATVLIRRRVLSTLRITLSLTAAPSLPATLNPYGILPPRVLSRTFWESSGTGPSIS